jgi:hypothetical protein
VVFSGTSNDVHQEPEVKGFNVKTWVCLSYTFGGDLNVVNEWKKAEIVEM